VVSRTSDRAAGDREGAGLCVLKNAGAVVVASLLIDDTGAL
jgi:hypothetical protein